MTAKVAINGYGTIGKRVADAVAAQDDMEIVGIVKTRPSFEAKIAQDKGYALYAAAKENIEDFKKSKMEVSGTLDELLDEAEIVVDATPGDTGEEYKKLYEKHGVKAIWQGGEEHELTGFSFNSEANYSEALGRDFTRVVSCNTTGLVRVLYALDTAFGVKKARVTLMRRAADPNDIKTGPINALIPDPIKLPSHHGPDVNSILPHIDITTMAVKTSTTLMHLHALNIELKKKCTEDDIVNVLKERPRIRLVSSKDRIKSTAEAMEFAKDLGRPRGDMWENVVWKDSIAINKGELYFFQAIHQEADVVPENVDAIRAMLEIEKDGASSIKKTNKALGI
ncbi:type II glyceraldehyde-3-phosphate dehydrogenase [Candidatus Methanoperedens nitratireducens]|uniref:Glyceraldehyde-3-phosphate dehydrogenase n=1 Tax=Candidatus Methanoperedens nitratireducens TaxID=1392998 RepID=A0A284VSE4_9EURY|nr:type II glyceraldehyde-3-phosphate dehydrogenase [Candidatus Methanoperedens nitroreducens]SNQ62128.1 Glyceraldehyde-3-phosphate dehydrogenase [Candidatus Methanoperedens nitroreducens]